MRPNHPLHNPFFNRFHEPVHRRDDDMQAYVPIPTDSQANEPNYPSEHARDRFGGLFALLVLAVSVALVLRAL
jgi:hypothetical protein